MQENKQQHAHDTYENMQQNTETKQAKKLQHSFCNYSSKKSRNNTVQKPNTKFKYIQQTSLVTTIENANKRTQTLFARGKQTWPTATARILQKRNFRSKFFK